MLSTLTLLAWVASTLSPQRFPSEFNECSAHELCTPQAMRAAVFLYVTTIVGSPLTTIDRLQPPEILTLFYFFLFSSQR